MLDVTTVIACGHAVSGAWEDPAQNASAGVRWNLSRRAEGEGGCVGRGEDTACVACASRGEWAESALSDGVCLADGGSLSEGTGLNDGAGGRSADRNEEAARADDGVALAGDGVAPSDFAAWESMSDEGEPSPGANSAASALGATRVA